MAGLVEKNYGDALFELITEENEGKLREVWDELTAVNSIISASPELIKLSKAPTVGKDEKLSVMEEAFKGKLSDYSYNFLMVLTEAGRLDYFGKIYRYFSGLDLGVIGLLLSVIMRTLEGRLLRWNRSGI